MSDTPLFDATLSNQLQLARRDAEIARARWGLAERAATERAIEVEREARLRIARAERRAADAQSVADQRVAEAERLAADAQLAADQRIAHVEREARVRQVLVIEQADERVRLALAEAAPPLPSLRIDLDEEREELVEREAPPVPSMEDLLRPSPGVTRFLDALLGSPES